MPELREYQQQDVDFIKSREATGIFSEQRTGKTPVACRCFNPTDAVLIICPASMVHVWAREWKIWNTGETFIPKTIQDDLSTWTTGACIMSYEKIRGTKTKESNLSIQIQKRKKFDGIIIDEAHRMKTRDSLTAQALRRLKKRARKRIALTGTPAPNRPWDVWALLNWLDSKMYKSYWDFVDTYFMKDVVWINGEPHEQPAKFKIGMQTMFAEELNKITVQRKRKDVMQWVNSELEPTIVKLPLGARQAKIIESLMTYFEYKDIITKNILENMIRVRQICSAPRILGIDLKSPKAEWLKDYISDYPEESILVFSNSKKLLLLLVVELQGKCGIISGDIDMKKRLQIIDSFQAERIKVLLCQTQACKEGLTLDRADTSIFLDVYPPAVDYAQAKDRMIATVPERSRPQKLIHVMMEKSYDERLYDLVNDNIDESQIVNDYKLFLKEVTHGSEHGTSTTIS